MALNLTEWPPEGRGYALAGAQRTVESNSASISVKPSPIQRSPTLGAGKGPSSLCSQPALRWPWPDDALWWGIARLVDRTGSPLQAPQAEALAGPRAPGSAGDT